jgi:hypothetical protein
LTSWLWFKKNAPILKNRVVISGQAAYTFKPAITRAKFLMASGFPYLC